jgi:hypothetical protein
MELILLIIFHERPQRGISKGFLLLETALDEAINQIIP